jgi:5'-nucleotidase
MASTILVDQDNVLADFIEATVRYMSKLYGYKGEFPATACKSYNILKNMFPALPDRTVTEMFEQLFSAPGFWSSMKPIWSAISVIESLYKEYDVYIVTTPWKTSKNCIPEKIEWVKKHLPFFDISKMIFCSHKHLLHADVIIEDSPVVLENNNCKYTIAFNYPYNENAQADYKVKDWLEVLDILLCDPVEGKPNQTLKNKLKRVSDEINQ